MSSRLVAAAQNQAVADAFVEGFNTPVQMWATLASPARAAVFLQRWGAQSTLLDSSLVALTLG